MRTKVNFKNKYFVSEKCLINQYINEQMPNVTAITNKQGSTITEKKQFVWSKFLSTFSLNSILKTVAFLIYDRLSQSMPRSDPKVMHLLMISINLILFC